MKYDAVTDAGLFLALAIALCSTWHWIGGGIAFLVFLIEIQNKK